MDEKKLTIYFTSDLHGYIYPTDYRGQGEKELGLFKCASRFRKDGNTLVIDGGDILQGSPLGAFCHDTIGSAARFAEMMNRCGYDYVTLGNHDFNYGMPYLDSYLNVLKARCVCENVRWDEAGVRFPARIHTLENGLRVGIIGIVTDYVNIWEKPEHLAGIAITDPIPAVAAALERLRDQVDLTVGIYHGGFERDLENAEKALEGVRLKVPDEVSEEKCDVCGRNMVIKSGRFGRFLACPGYPECTFTKPLVIEMPGRCPKCGGRMMKRTGVSKKTNKQYTYYACEFSTSSDPEKKCDFMTWDVPTKDDCPECGQTMFKKAGKGFKRPYCINPACSRFVPEDQRGYVKKKTTETAEEGAESAEAADAAETAAKKTAARKTTAKKSTTAKKTSTKAASTKKTATKTAAAKKTTKKAAAEDGAEKPAKKTAAKKTATTKKAAAKKTTAKSAAKKTAEKEEN